MEKKKEKNSSKSNKAEQAGLLWHLLPPSSRKKIARLLELREIRDLNQGYLSYLKKDGPDRARIEKTLIADTRPGYRHWPVLAFFTAALLFVALFVLHSWKLPALPVNTRILIFSPLLLGTFAPLSFYLLPNYRLRALFRLSLDPETLAISFFSFLGLIWTLFEINWAGAVSYGRPSGLTLLVLALGAACAPLLEELFFRELVPATMGKPPYYAGHLLGSALFALSHVPGSGKIFFYYMIAGLFLSLVRVRSGGLLYPVLIHSLANLTHQLIL